MSALPADPQHHEADGLRYMRRVATGLFVLMALLYIAARMHEADHTWIGFVRAFAEAAMIGALADWFAVVALFRHPLGLPIPHTAIIPRNKDRIGEGLGRFIETNFLAPEIVSHKLADADLAGGLARWLKRPKTADLIAVRISRVLPTLLDALDDDDLRRLLHTTVTGRLERVQLAPLAGDALGLLTKDGRHRPLVDELLEHAADVVHEYEPLIRERVRERTAWLWRAIGVDAIVADKLITLAEETLTAARDDPEHAWRLKLDDQIASFADQLKTSPELNESAEALKAELLAHPAVARYLQSLWNDLRTQVAADVARPDSRIRAHLVEALDAFADRLTEDEVIQRKANRLLRTIVEQAAATGRHAMADLIAQTVHKWDAQTVGRKIELAVGKDLQFVRINGTLIGGLVGLTLHSISQFLPG